ncbi:MAG: (2Fe-2S)-binding protein [Pseudomonadota bacterium]
MAIKLTVNGQPRTVDVEPDTPLLWVLRETLELTGTKFGCGIAQCGACTVHIDGVAQRSCVTPIESVADAKITTVEGLDDRVSRAVQDAWVAADAPQCGYCQSGQVMAAVALLRENAAPSDSDIDDAMAGNICRCATYHRIRQAIHAAAQTMKG